MRLARLAFLVSVTSVFGCGLILGVGDLDAPGEIVNPGRTDSSPTDATAMPDTLPPPTPVVVDAEAFDSGEAGYTSLVGKWAGNWNQDFTIVGGGATLQLAQDGGSLSGTGEVTGTPCGSRTGSIDGGFIAPDKIQGYFSGGDLVLELSATITNDAGKLSARFHSVGSCLPGAFGSANVTRQ